MEVSIVVSDCALAEMWSVFKISLLKHVHLHMHRVKATWNADFCKVVETCLRQHRDR